MSHCANRREIVKKACENWIKRLIDVSRRNNLLYFRPLKRGTLDFSGIDKKVFASLLKGRSARITRIFAKEEIAERGAKVVYINRKAIENLEERGLETLFLAAGMATWHSVDRGRQPNAPVVLLPVKVSYKAGDASSITIQIQGDLQVNSVLSYYWQEQFGVTLDVEKLADRAIGEKDGAIDLDSIFDSLEQAEIKGLAIDRQSLHFANFSFQKMAMVDDLKEDEIFAEHEIIAAIAGDRKVKRELSQKSVMDAREIDEILPEDEFLVLDADSSQHLVIDSVVKGQSCVIQGPPGTGKSQTIANLIASLVANRKSVLFVAEKRAALEVVKKRLAQVHLEKFLIDVHGVDISRREIMQCIGDTLEQIKESPPADSAETHRNYTKQRGILNTHVTRLHTQHPPSGRSVFELRTLLLELPDEVKTVTTRWRGQSLRRLNDENVQQILGHLQTLQKFPDLFLGERLSPWNKAATLDSAMIQRCLDICAQLRSEDWTDFQGAVRQLIEQYQLQIADNLQEVAQICQVFAQSLRLWERYADDIFAHDLENIAHSLASSAKKPLANFLLWAFNSSYRKAYRTMKSLLKPGKEPLQDFLADVEEAIKVAQLWPSQKPPVSSPLFHDIQRYSARIYPLVEQICELINDKSLLESPLNRVAELLDELYDDQVTPYQTLELVQSVAQLGELGMEPFLQELKRAAISPDLWQDCFRYTWWQSCYDERILKEPQIQSFLGEAHQKEVEKFQDSDQRRIKLAAERVKNIHAQWAVRSMNKYPVQTDILRREVKKKRRHLPLRKLIEQTASVLMSVCPCWMASPLSISQLLDVNRYFDVVVFDEASQILPEDAIPSIVRARQVVVAGDSKQLPPTAFFTAGTSSIEDDEDIPETEGFESFLDILASFLPNRTLQWHYRSRDERLIAFSNDHIYGKRLVTFPGAGGKPPIAHILVDSAQGDKQEESSTAEVGKVIELILEHATNHPEESLGVVALGVKHAQRIQTALDHHLRENRMDSEFFAEQKEQRFFIKNLERVQGDERDHIILSVGYSKNRNGVLRHNFGPINQDGGERRLNVVVSRARQRMTVVSSFTSEDIDLAKSKAEGVRLLKLYLAYAANGGEQQSRSVGTSLDAFAKDIYQTLTARGMKLLPKFGIGRYQLDFAVQHPQHPEWNVLAIECDGATYHEVHTARERDRLRQQQLEAIGWRFCRIWSTDWFNNKIAEVERIVNCYQKAIENAEQNQQRLPEQTVIGEEVARQQPQAKTRKEPRPHLEIGAKIDKHPMDKLVELANWIESDQVNRTQDELLGEMVKELGYKKRGAKIVRILTEAMQHARRNR